MRHPEAYRPPAPQPMSPLRSLLRVIKQGDGDLLSLLPSDAYQKPITSLGYSRRSIVLVNSAQLCREVLHDPNNLFPKNDLFVGALEDLIGDSIFVSSGDTWRRQRRMIDPAFSHIRLDRAYRPMNEAIDDAIVRLDKYADSGSQFSLDLAMSHLTADVICRTTFSQSLDSQAVKEVFDSFSIFERSVASVNLTQLIFGKPWAKVKQPEHVQQACSNIRDHIKDLIEPRLNTDAPQADDLAGAIINAIDEQTGKRFNTEELVDQLGVFFLAGHETSASVLIWVFFIVSQRPDIAKRIQQEIQSLNLSGEIQMHQLKQLPYIRNVFKETLRLYPPITFIPRVANKSTVLGGRKIKKGTMVMISPWATHRNNLLWDKANIFDANRFIEGEQVSNEKKGLFMSFGLGPRVCIGAAFATMEATLIMARLLQRYEFHVMQADSVRPVARLTTRPATEIQCTVKNI